MSLPHGLGADILLNNTVTPTSADSTPLVISQKRERTSDSMKVEDDADDYSPKKRVSRSRKGGKVKVAAKSANGGPQTAKSANGKKFKYWDSDPYPDHNNPPPEQYHDVVNRLVAVHGPRLAPKENSVPDLERAGCGDVPEVLDALLRTLLSGNTAMKNADSAIRGLRDAFGTRQFTGGPLSLNWDAVHKADVKDVETAIRSGGLASKKSRDIKEILQIVYEDNLGRREAMELKQETDEDAKEIREKADGELARLRESLLTLDHLKKLDTMAAMKAMYAFRGIGVKTAACVILFCFLRPSYAVDTHVWRLSMYLGWAPQNATADLTWAHCERHVPDELKYSLHQLFIQHGQDCYRCRAGTSPGSKEWGDCICPLEDLVDRDLPRKGPKRGKRVFEEVEGAEEAEGTAEGEE